MRRLRQYTAVTAAVAALLTACTAAGSGGEAAVDAAMANGTGHLMEVRPERSEAPTDPWVGDRSNALTARVEL